MSKKRRVTNEEIGKILFEAIQKHSARMETHENSMHEISEMLELRIFEAKQLNFQPDWTPIQKTLNQFTEQTEISVKAVQKTIKTPNYLLYSMLAMILVTLISVGMTIYSMKTISQNSKNQKQIQALEEMRIYFQTFLNESTEGKKAFEEWKAENENH